MIRLFVQSPGSNHTGTFGMADSFEASMNVKFGEDMFDVIIDGCRADVKLIGNCSCALALCQAL